MDIDVELTQDALTELNAEITREGHSGPGWLGISGLGGDERAVFVVARIDGAVVGCATLSGLRGPDGELLKLYVSQPCRGTGVGEALVHAAFEEARRLGVERLHIEIAGGSRPFWTRALEGQRMDYIPPAFVEVFLDA